MEVYSFLDLMGALAFPYVGSFPLAGGQIGLGSVTINYTTDRTEHDIASDGSIMVSYKAGNSGSVDLECQQTSALYSFLLGWHNSCVTAADNGDVSNWAAGTIAFRSLTDSRNFVITGCSSTKIPDKVYTAQGQKVRWKIMAANISST